MSITTKTDYELTEFGYFETSKTVIHTEDTEVQLLKSKLKAQQELIDVIREALVFYSNIIKKEAKPYLRQGYYVYNLKKEIYIDGGTKARQALAKLEAR